MGRELFRYCKGDAEVTFTGPFLMFAKVNFDKHVHVLERSCQGDISYIFTNLYGSLSKTQRSLKI